MVTSIIAILVASFFIALAAFFNSCMDKVETVIAFNDSVFHKKNKSFYCKPIAAHNVKFLHNIKYLPLKSYRPCFWHLCKSAMIVSFSFAFATCILFPFRATYYKALDFLIIISVFGILWNKPFNLFYDKILKKKEK